MSRPTVSVIANELLTSGVLMEGDRVSSGGAPGTLLEIARDTGVTLVVDLRRTEDVTLATVSPGGEVVKRMSTSITSEAGLLKVVTDFRDSLDRKALIGTAVAVHGFIDPYGVWQNNPSGELDVTVIEQLRRKLRMDVWPVNATDAITLADMRDSAEELAASATVVVRGISIGLVVDGGLLSGSKRPAGDIAHIVTGVAGPRCEQCGRQCLFAAIEPMLRGDSSPELHRRVGAGIAAVVGPICAAIELEEVVLALIPQASATAVRDATSQAMSALLQPSQMPRVRLSQQGEDAVLIGAALMYLHKRLI